MRGKGPDAVGRQTAVRITPAYAGKSYFFLSFRPVFQDHPRVCGEKFQRLAAVLGKAGSPPRMRGKGSDLARRMSAKGITPAYAGKSMMGS